MAKKQTEWGILTGNWVRRATDVTDCLIGEECVIKGNVDPRLNVVLGDRSVLEVPD